MKLLVTGITFAITMGGLFLFESYKTQPQEENYAQIVQGLANQNQNNSPTPKLTNKSNKAVVKTPATSPTQLPTSPISSPTPSFTTTPIATLSPTPPPTPTPTSIFTPTFTPTLTPTSQPVQQNDQITVVSLTSPVKQNEPAQLEIKTAPEARCTIKVTLPSGSQSSAKGLEDKTADNSGAVTWSWKINWNTTPGTANIDITCSKNGQSFSKSLQMEIVER